jgi:hypothetical protein
MDSVHLKSIAMGNRMISTFMSPIRMMVNPARGPRMRQVRFLQAQRLLSIILSKA